MRRFVALSALLALACSDYGLNKRNDNNNNDDSDDETGTDETGDTPIDEDCNGEDDDGDGDIDEGWPDLDGDGTADCTDDECVIEVAEATDCEIDEECAGLDISVEDPWNVVQEWHWAGLASNTSIHNVIILPVQGNLTDTDADGDIDTDDTPNVVFVAFAGTAITSGATLVVLDGATGAEVWDQTGFNGGGGIALADLDNDGFTDILAFDSMNRPIALEGDGTTKWTSSTAAGSYYGQATVADVDMDGDVEGIFDNLLVDGATGTVEETFPMGYSIPYRMPAVGDIDLDGEQEVIVGNTCFSPDGTTEWTASVTGTYGHWAAILDVDGDPEGEVNFVGAGRFVVIDDDGTELVNEPAGTTQPGPQCVADFDGDGSAEVAWASAGIFNMAETDGSVNWTASIDDSSGLAGCSGYDIDGDGAFEVLYSDQQTFWVFDGASGDVLYSSPDQASGTLWEYPSVSDIDNDGSAEFVTVSNDYWFTDWRGVTAWGHVSDGWPRSGTTWHTHDFAVTNINPDGTVPMVPDPSWQLYNVYRARPAVDGALTNLQVQITDVCFAGCDVNSAIFVAVQVYNTGGVESETSIPITIFKNNGTLTPIATEYIAGPIASGEAPEGIVFEITYADWGTQGIVVRVDDDGTGEGKQPECDEADNHDSYTDTPC